MKKRIISVILAALFLLPLFTFVSFADDTGQLGDNVFWRFDSSTGCLTVYGSGRMYDYDNYTDTNLPKKIKSIVIEEGVENVGRSVFYYQNTVSSVTLPDSIETIEDNAFGIVGIKSIDIPRNVKYIGQSAFAQCFALKSVKIPDSVTEIGSSAFYKCSALDSVTVSSSITSIERETFAACISLTSITVPDGVKSIGEYSFIGCSSLTSITIPESVTDIGRGAFSVCSALETIDLPDKITRIEDNLFELCSSLKNISIPDGVTHIGNGAFLQCKALTKIIIPDSVTSIGDHAFEGCKTLENIDIPDSVNSIGRFILNDTLYYSTGKNWTDGKVGRSALYVGNHLIAAMIGNSDTLMVRKGTLTVTDITFFYGIGDKKLYIPKSVKYIGDISINYLKDVYYEGSEADREKNGLMSALSYATWHYNSYWAGKDLASKFTDIRENAWYVNDVYYAQQCSLLVGTGNKKFSPEMPMTRAMFMATIYRMEGEPPVTKDDYFVDVYEGKWYSDAINWAAEVGIVVGVGNGRFNPEESIKREEVAAILFDYTWLHDGNIYDRVDLYKYGDGYKTDLWAFEDMSWAVANGLIVGTDKGLEPRATATRAQVASILVRYISKFS